MSRRVRGVRRGRNAPCVSQRCVSLRFTHPIPETLRLVNVGCCHFCCAPFSSRQQRRGEGGWGSGGRDLGAVWSLPPEPRVWTLRCELLDTQRRHERCFSPTILFVLATCAGGTAPGVAQHGCAAVGGPNYKRVCPSLEARTTIGCRGSFERTEKQFARSGSVLGALLPGGRVGFTIRFSFLPDHIDQFAQLASHSDFGLLLVGSAAMRQAVV